MPVHPAGSWEEMGQRVADARKAAGLNQEELAQRLGLDRTAISKIESGTRRIDTLEVAQLARALNRSVEWFVSAPRPAIVSRRRTGADERGRLRADALLEEAASGVELLVELGFLNPPPAVPLDRAVTNVADAERAAGDVRIGARLPAGPLRDLARHAEKLGLYAMVLDLGAGVDGLYVAIDRGGVALINGAAESGRRRFTLAHEIGHHVLADEYSSDFDVTAGVEERERLVNAFAIHFLMPRAAVTARWSELRLERDPRASAISLGSEYGVSWSAACPQFRNLGLLTQSECDALLAGPPRRVDYLELGVEVIPEPQAPAVPPQYAAAVVKAYKARKLSATRACELLHRTVTADDLPALRGLPFAAVTDS